MSSYLPLSLTSDSQHAGSCDADIELPGVDLEGGISTNADTVIILFREKKVTIALPDDTSFHDTTVSEFKCLVAEKTEVAVTAQRLIFSGRVLQPADKTLADFNIVNNSSVHLYPTLRQSQSVSTSTSAAAIDINSSRAVVASPMHGPGNSNNPYAPAVNSYNTQQIHNAIRDQYLEDEGHLPSAEIMPLLLDPFIAETCREVRLWSSVLIMLSALTLVSNFSVLLTNGSLGRPDIPLDGFVAFLDTIVSCGGVYVGQLGMKSARSLRLQDVKKYSYYLGVLALMAIFMRVVWVFDVVEEVKADIKAENALKEAEAAQPTQAPSTATDDAYGQSGVNSRPNFGPNAVFELGLQASVVALFICSAWLTCVIRAVRLRNAVSTFPLTADQRAGADNVVAGTGVPPPERSEREQEAVSSPIWLGAASAITSTPSVHTTAARNSVEVEADAQVAQVRVCGEQGDVANMAHAQAVEVAINSESPYNSVQGQGQGQGGEGAVVEARAI